MTCNVLQDPSSVSLGVKLNGQKFKGRALRVQQAVKKEKVKIKDNKKGGHVNKNGSKQKAPVKGKKFKQFKQTTFQVFALIQFKRMFF